MLEQEMEALLVRLAPGAHREFEGATSEDIARIEELAGSALPEFYRWLLTSCGTNAGRLERFFAPYYARNVLNAYDTGEVDIDPPSLFIARFEDPIVSMDVYYDLSRPSRDDALVVTSFSGELTNSAETLREWLAYGIVTGIRINRSRQRCYGMLDDEEGNVSGALVPVLESLGFVSSVRHGAFCGIFERPDAAFVYKIEVEPDSADVLSFSLGGQDVTTLRRILGEIATKTRIAITIRDWMPPLTTP